MHTLRRSRGIWYSFFGGEPPYELEQVNEDTPEVLKPRLLYVVLEDGEPWHIAMLCPCGCGAILEMNTIQDEHPFWKITRHWHGLPSVHPSIWRQKGCKAHFWLRKGRILWC